jgi:hypothetical protein
VLLQTAAFLGTTGLQAKIHDAVVVVDLKSYEEEPDEGRERHRTCGKTGTPSGYTGWGGLSSCLVIPAQCRNRVGSSRDRVRYLVEELDAQEGLVIFLTESLETCVSDQ